MSEKKYLEAESLKKVMWENFFKEEDKWESIIGANFLDAKGGEPRLWFQLGFSAGLDTVVRADLVQHEMSAREFFPKWFEICNTYLPDDCYHCPLYLHTNSRKFTPPCMYLMMTDAEQAISIVEKWAIEHPEDGGKV